MKKIRANKHIQALGLYKPGRDFNGEDKHIVSLCSNENNLGPSALVKETILNNISEIYKYPDANGTLLKAAISEHLKIRLDNICLGNGSDRILNGILRAFLMPGEEILSSEGSFAALDTLAASNNITIRKVPLRNSMAFDLELILRNITKQTKLIYLCNPNNPTGGIFTKEELEYFISKVSKDILVIVDEAYFEYAQYLSVDYPDSKLLAENVITLRTFSKAYALAGLRLGYAIGPNSIMKELEKVLSVFSPNIFAQLAGISALRDKNHLEKTLQLNAFVLKQYQNCFDGLNLKYGPAYANFICLIFENDKEAEIFESQMNSKNILVRSCRASGLENMVRVSTGTIQECEIFLETIRSIYKENIFRRPALVH